MAIKYPVGTVLIALVGEAAYRGEALAEEPVVIPPDTVGVVVDVIEAVDSEYFVHFPSHSAKVLLEETLLDDRRRYVALPPADVARMYERLKVSDHNVHCILVALESKPASQAVALAQALAMSEKLSMSAFLQQYEL